MLKAAHPFSAPPRCKTARQVLYFFPPGLRVILISGESLMNFFCFPRLCALCPVFAAAGFFFRTLQVHHGFEAGTGLAIPGFAPGYLALLMAALVIAAALLCALRTPFSAELADLRVCRFPFLPAQIAYGLLTAVMGILLMSSHAFSGRLSLLLGAVCLMTALYALLMPFVGARLRIVFLMEHTVFYVLWLVIFFSRHSSDPVWMGFWPPLLALCALSGALCALSGAACGVGRPRRMLFLLLCGGGLSLIAAADCCSYSALPDLLGFLGAAVFQFACAFRLCSAAAEHGSSHSEIQ